MSEIESRAKIEKKIKVRERWLKSLSVVALLILIAGLGIFIYLQTSYQTRTQLENPVNVRVEKLGDSVYLKYDKVKNAVAYRYSVDGNVVQVSADDLAVDISALVETPKKYEISVQALGGDSHKNSDPVFAEEFVVTKTLARPVVDIDKYDSKLVWVSVDGADMYEITTIVNGDFSTATTEVVSINEYDISDVVVDFTKEYSFTVKAISENEYINQSPASLSIGHSLKGKLATPTDLAYDSTNGSLHWSEVENAETYTIVLTHGNQGSKEIISNQNFFVFEASDIQDIGEYEAYVYANNVSETNEEEETIWFLASEKSETVTFSVYKQLAAPNQLGYQMNGELIWFSWANVENAKSYTIELVNAENVVYHQKITYVNEINLRRDLANAVGGNFRVRIQANGYGYYTSSEFSAILELNAYDQFAPVRNIEVLENGKYLTFSASNQNIGGTITFAAQNGYTVLITKEGGDEVYNNVVYETLIDTSAIFVEPINYSISITVNAYSYFTASQSQTASYAHQIGLDVPTSVGFGKAMHLVGEDNEPYLILLFGVQAEASDASVWLDGVDYENVLTQYTDFIELVLESEEAKLYSLNVSALYNQLYEYEPLDVARKYSAKVKAIGNAPVGSSVAGYKDSKYSNVAMHENKIKLAAPTVVQVDNSDEESVLLYFTRSENATSYQISITSVISGETSITTSRLTTCDIYDIISAGDNTITVTALGSGYYENSEPSEVFEYTYTPILKAPKDVSVTENMVEGTTHYYAEFTTTRFAEYYKVDIRKTHELTVVDGVKQVVELSTSTFETLSQNFTKGAIRTQCDITNFLITNGHGKYEIRVRAVLTQPEVTETPLVYSDYSNVAVYSYFDKQPAPTNLQFDLDTNILTFTGVETANNGYIVKISLIQGETVLSNEIIATTNSVDLTNNIAGFGGVGNFEITAMTRKVDELFLSNSDWATPAVSVAIRAKLSDPANFKYNEDLQEVSWSSDVRMEYEHLKLTFTNQYTTNLVLAEIVDQSFSLSAVNIRNYLRQYGDGFYKFEVQSFSTRDMVDPSERVTYTYTKYVELDSPVLISVSDVNNRVEAKFATIANAKSYAIIAKLPTQTTWAKIKTGIPDGGQANITVDIKANLAALFGANKYDIAVVAEAYDYFLESEPSNSLQFELWLNFSAPENLRGEEIDGVYYLVWDAVTYAETYSFALDNALVEPNVTQTRYDLTDIIGDQTTGRFLLGVRVNATGYYYASAYTTFDFYLENKIAAPTLTYDSETHILLIDGQGVGVGYEISIDYYEDEATFESGTPTGNTTVSDVQATRIDLTTSMRITGLGIYVIKAREIGDDLYWRTSDWSSDTIAYYTVKLDSLLMMNVDKVNNGGQLDNYMKITKPEGAIYENALVRYDFYEIDSIDADIEEGQIPSVTVYNVSTDFLIEGLENAKYYKVTATVLGAFNELNAYNAHLSGSALTQAVVDLAYYTNSEPTSINISTFGNQLSAPTITNVTMTAENKLQITFNKVLNANNYDLKVVRQSQSVTIYDKLINEENTDAYFTADSIVVTIPVLVSGFSDKFDIYDIKVCANEVLNESGEVAYAKSPYANFAFEHTVALTAPVVGFTKQADGTLRIQVQNIEFATGYELELAINGFTQTYNLGVEGYTILSGTQYGSYKARAKAIGDEYHKDSEWSAYYDYVNSLELSGVQAVVIIDNATDSSPATRIYAQWDEVVGAKVYGVKIQKDGANLYETTTNKTYYDLISLFRENGYGVYTVWVKTNGDGAYIAGESDYTKYDTYKYKGQFEIPIGFEVYYDYNIEVYPTTLKYFAKFGEISGAKQFVVTIYNGDTERTVAKTITLQASDLTIENGNMIANLTDELKQLNGGVYFASIQVAETSQNLASGVSEMVEFVNYHIHENPSLYVSQVGDTPFVRVSFDEVDNVDSYSMFINGARYDENGETFTYPSGGYIDVSAKFLNIGSTNVFVVKLAGDRADFYLDTFYSANMGAFTFTLQKVEDINITQDSLTQIPDATTYNVWLTFTQVDFATGYQLWVDDEKVADLEVGQERYNVSAIFKNRMPKDNYKIQLVAVAGENGLQNSEASEYTFDYTLQFSAPTQLDVATATAAIATWNAPANLTALSALASRNSVTLAQQQYTVVVYYVGVNGEVKVFEKTDVTDRNFDVSEYVEEAGEYRIEVYASANGVFDKSATCASTTYHKYVKLDAVQNVSIYKDGDKVRLSFDKVTEFGYVNARQNLYYQIYLNGGSILRVGHSSSTMGIDITQYLWGGDNNIYIITKDEDESHYIQSDNSAVASYNFTTVFTAIFNARIHNNDAQNKQLFRFDSFKVNGMTEDEILDLTYTLSFYNALTGDTLISSRNDYLATKLDSDTFEIDVTSVINNQPGVYKIVAKINGYNKTFTVNSTTTNFVMGDSPETTIQYSHKLRAETLDLSLLVIDTEGKERVNNEGLEMQEMWLSFDVKFTEEYVAQADKLDFVLLINQREYTLSVPYSAALIDTTVTATGYMTGGTATVSVSTNVKILQRIESGKKITTLSFSLIELLQADGFNIYMTGAISIKAKSGEQGYYLESAYQTNYLKYDYYLRYMTPTGLELVTRDDGLHYIKWNEPIHPHINDYYCIIDAYNVTITSQGVVGETGVVTDPNSTLGGKHTQDFIPDEIIADDGYLYYNVEEKLFAGHNKISLKCNASPSRFYYESGTVTIEKQPYNKKIKTPIFAVQDLPINLTGGDTARKGVEIIITNVDNVVDYDDELRKVVNYNQSAIYRLTITSNSECKADAPNPTQSTYLSYSVDFKVGKSGIYQFIAGDSIYNRVSYAYSDNKGKLHITWQFAEPAVYTYTVQALGNTSNYTLDSDVATLTHATTYNAPALAMSVSVYKNDNGVDKARTALETMRMSKIVINWQTELSKFYNAEYQLDIVGMFNSGSSLVIPSIIIKNATSITFSETENVEIFEQIKKRPANYEFRLKSLKKSAPLGDGSGEEFTYYLESAPVSQTYNYIVKINTPSDLSVLEKDGKAYIVVAIPQYLIDAGIETNTYQIFVSYKITQLDPSFNLGSNARQLSNADYNAPVLLGETVVGENDGHYYIDISGNLYPSDNQIEISFNKIEAQNFAKSDSATFEYNYKITLDQIKNFATTNLYDQNGYVQGMAISFENVQFNKYFAYRLDIVGTTYNAGYKKSLILKVDPSSYVAGSANNYRNVKCYEIAYGSNSIAGQRVVTANQLRSRDVSGGSYVYNTFNYAPCSASSTFANKMTFLVLVDGGLPDKYNLTITTLGELDQTGQPNALLSDLPIAAATKSSQPSEFSYILKGTLVPTQIQIGTSDGGAFVESRNNASNNALAYVYYSGDASQSFVYLNYAIGGDTRSLTKYSASVVLRLTIMDSQAQKYILYVKSTRDNKLSNFDIIKKTGAAYTENMSGVTVSYDAGAQKYVAYVDLLSLAGGVLSKNGGYQLYVAAYNDSKIANAQNRDELIYDAAEVNSDTKYANRFNKVVTPTLSYDAGNKRFIVSNFVQIENIINSRVGSRPYDVVINLSQGGASAKELTFGSGTIVQSRSTVAPYKVGTKLYIPYDYVASELDEQGYSIGTTEVKVWFDVEESGFIWDSDCSNEVTFNYKAYLGFPNFAVTKSEYNGGVYATTGNRRDVYSDYTFGSTYELASKIESHYTLNATSYVQSQNWKVAVRITYNGDYTDVEFETGSNISLVAFQKSRSSVKGFIGELLGSNPDYGSYRFSMRIVGVYDRNGRPVSSDKIDYDTSSYTRNFIVKYKLFAPSTATLSLNSDESKVEKLYVTYRSDSILAGIPSYCKVHYDIERENRGAKSGSAGLNRTAIDYGSTFNLSLDDSGTYIATCYVSCDSVYDDYIVNSKDRESNKVTIPFVPGIKNASVTINDNNNVTLTITVGKLKNPDSMTFETGQLDANKFEYDLELYNAYGTGTSTGKVYSGTISEIQSQLSEDFKSIMSNKTTRSFAPGDYYFSIKTTNEPEIGGFAYKKSKTFYCNSQKSYDKNNLAQLKNGASKCVYRVGYKSWSQNSSMTLLHTSNDYKGLLTGAAITPLMDGKDASLSFVRYMLMGQAVKNSSIEHNYDVVSAENTASTQTLNLVFSYNSLSRGVSYARAANTGSDQKLNLSLYLRIDSTLLKNQFNALPFKSNMDITDYVVLLDSDYGSATYDNKTYNNYIGQQGVAKRQRLSPPSNVSVRSEQQDWDLSHIYAGYNYYASWRNPSSNNKYTDCVTLSYYFYFSTNVDGTTTNPYRNMEIDWTDILIGNYTLKLLEKYKFAHALAMSGSVFEMSKDDTSYKFYRSGADHAYIADGIWGHLAQRMYRTDKNKVWVLMQVKSNSSEYDDSAVIQKDNWGHLWEKTFEKAESQRTIPDFET